MAKQTFTTGQVLTAAQMTSLQQTAMGGGDTTAKTTSYVLVAADAGTVVAMNAAGATTITVNTSLFAAGDTVFIQNRGAGICTITAGTATVSTAGSLALGQHEGGTLYFTATGSAVFYDYVQTGAVSPLTTKGDIWGYSTLDARIAIGANDTVLTADSTQALGLKWAASSAGANWSLLNSGGTALTGASTITVSGISGKDKIMILIDSASTTAGDNDIGVRFNTDSGSNYYRYGYRLKTPTTYAASILVPVNGVSTNILIGGMSDVATSEVSGYCMLSGCNSAGVKIFESAGSGLQSGSENQELYNLGGYYNSSSTISSISVVSSSGNFDGAGKVYVYTSA
jgi:hypothetical protein